MEMLKLCYIDEQYINYLREFDKTVPYNKKHTRPYIGVVYSFNGFNYFAPLSSPKAKHLNMNSDKIDIFKINNGKLGIVNINNMIPTPKECLTNVFDVVNDEKYKSLLIKQLEYLNGNRNKLFAKIQKFWNQYNKGYINKTVLNRCCNFKLLEEKSLEYKVKIAN